MCTANVLTNRLSTQSVLKIQITNLSASVFMRQSSIGDAGYTVTDGTYRKTDFMTFNVMFHFHYKMFWQFFLFFSIFVFISNIQSIFISVIVSITEI